ncbi:MAG: hypothetical protein ACRCZF_00975, partial [Gemmataceae bacterium]
LGLRAAKNVQATMEKVIKEAEQAAKEQEEREMKEFEEDSKTRELPAPADDSDVPKPAPQPPKLAVDDEATHKKWFVLLRSKKPGQWNTSTNTATDFAVPLRAAPKEVKYLRLRRLDTNEFIIIAINRGMLGMTTPSGATVRWNGENENAHGGYHLGIAHGKRAGFMEDEGEGKGMISVLMDGWDANAGSGFGHAHHIEKGGQKFSWKGKEIPATTLEFSVTDQQLSASEQAQLLANAPSTSK